MTQYLPPNLLALFAPRDPMPFLPPLDKLPIEKKLPPYGGVAQHLNEFEDPKDTPPPTRVENREERKERKRKERAEQVAYKLEQDLALWDPLNDPNATSDPYKSLFVGRINYDTSESKLRRELEAYGPVKKIRIVSDTKSSRPRGYAFVEYEHERDMHSAYKHADGKKIDGRRVLVDIERGRTIKGWRPRRLGGGLGGTRRGGPDVNTKFSGRDDGFGAGREDRERSRSRERGRRDRGRSRSRSRERPRRRSRSPRERRRRSRSKERVERGERAERVERVERGDRGDKEKTTFGDAGEREEKRRRRSRSRDRPRRSRSRDRKRRRSRSPRESRKRSRSRERAEPRPEEPATDHGAGDMMPGEDIDGFQIKQEPVDSQQGYADGDFNAYNQPPPPENGNQGYNFNEYGTGEEGEAQ